jgi:hypothetical protein
MNELRPKYKLLKQRLQISKKMLSLGFNIKILNQNILYIEKLKKTQIIAHPNFSFLRVQSQILYKKKTK